MRLAPLLLLLSALMVVGCGSKTTVDPHDHAEDAGHEDEGHEEGLVKLSAEQTKLAGIEVAPVSQGVVQASLDVPGVVSSTSAGRAIVTPPAAGRVTAIHVSIGQRVSRGQVLALVESVDLAQAWATVLEAERQSRTASSALAEAKSEVALALGRAESAQKALKGVQELAKEGAFSQVPLQAAQAELNDAQAELISVQTERASHAEAVRRLEALFRDGIVSRGDLEAARLELVQDQIRLDRAGSRLSAAKSALERERTIASRGLLNAKEIQAAEAELRAAGLEVDRARVRERSAIAAARGAQRAVVDVRQVYLSASGGAKANAGKVALTAPISGIVTHLGVTQGQAVDRTQSLMEVEDLDSVWVTASLPEQDAAKARVGQAATVAVSSLPGKEFTGVIQSVGDRLDPKTRTLPVRCLINKVRGQLKPEMYATVRLLNGQPEMVTAIPTGAITEEKGAAYTYVKHQEGFKKTLVKVGRRDGGHVEVVSGLKRGDQVVVKGAFVLASEEQKSELKGHEH